MTRKDYIAIADAIATIERTASVDERTVIGAIVGQLRRTLAMDNPNFDETKFIKSCMPITLKHFK